MKDREDLAHEVELKRDDRSRVKIVAKLIEARADSPGGCLLNVFVRAPGGNLWLHPDNPHSYGYRAPNTLPGQTAALRVVAQEELNAAALGLWEQIKP